MAMTEEEKNALGPLYKSGTALELESWVFQTTVVIHNGFTDKHIQRFDN